jgi:hypothetical protein
MDAIMTGFRSFMVMMPHGGMPAASTPGGRASSPRSVRSSSAVTPPWVTAATGPGGDDPSVVKDAAPRGDSVAAAQPGTRDHWRGQRRADRGGQRIQPADQQALAGDLGMAEGGALILVAVYAFCCELTSTNASTSAPGQQWDRRASSASSSRLTFPAAARSSR